MKISKKTMFCGGGNYLFGNPAIIQHDKPADNLAHIWVLAPAADFAVTIRCYWPDAGSYSCIRFG
jgi:hypothetical protein